MLDLFHIRFKLDSTQTLDLNSNFNSHIVKKKRSSVHINTLFD